MIPNEMELMKLTTMEALLGIGFCVAKFQCSNSCTYPSLRAGDTLIMVRIPRVGMTDGGSRMKDLRPLAESLHVKAV